MTINKKFLFAAKGVSMLLKFLILPLKKKGEAFIFKGKIFFLAGIPCLVSYAQQGIKAAHTAFIPSFCVP